MRISFRINHKTDGFDDIAGAIEKTGKVLPPGEYRVAIERTTCSATR